MIVTNYQRVKPTLSQRVVAAGFGSIIHFAKGCPLSGLAELTGSLPPFCPALPPSSFGKNTGSLSPPFVYIRVPRDVACPISLVQHRTQATPKLGVQESAEVTPFKVAVVEVIVFVQLVEVLRQFTRRREIIHMDERAWWRHLLVVLLSRSHHHGYHIVSVNIQISLLYTYLYT